MRKKRGSKWTPEQRRKFEQTMRAKRGKPAALDIPLDAIPAPARPKGDYVSAIMRKASRLQKENELLRELVQHYMGRGA